MCEAYTLTGIEEVESLSDLLDLLLREPRALVGLVVALCGGSASLGIASHPTTPPYKRYR